MCLRLGPLTRWSVLPMIVPLFVAAIETALTDNAPDVITARRAVAGGNTWDMRVAQIEGLLQDALARRLSQRSLIPVS